MGEGLHFNMAFWRIAFGDGYSRIDTILEIFVLSRVGGVAEFSQLLYILYL